uniref:Adrenomedullin 2 n=1 Tax=Gopherus agassizii TaxID=38772 RepID=A0A452HY15_9SAUR
MQPHVPTPPAHSLLSLLLRIPSLPSPPLPSSQLPSFQPARPAAVPSSGPGAGSFPLDWEQPGGALPQPLAGPKGRARRSLTGPWRAKRHAAPRRHHAHLMRVGCVLGTCQVQNLGHRLWQLMGQSGLQDSSPMNPNSPHSYG